MRCLRESKIEALGIKGVVLKKSLAVICGEIDDFGLVSCFEALYEQFDVSVYILGSEQNISIGASFPVTLFNSLEEMPGYMRDLEHHVDDVDLILCIELSRLSSFQALKLAQKRNVPLVALTSEVRPYQYVQFPNIQAIRNDVVQRADMIVATTPSSRDKLLVEGVDQSKVHCCLIGSNCAKFSRSAAGRQKFREYVGLGEADIVMLFRDDLVSANRPIEVLNLAKALVERLPSVADRLKIIFCGNGDQAESLKYLACDLGISKNALFLHQNIEKFAVDLYSSCDFALVTRKTDNSYVDASQRWLIDAMSCGAIPVVPAADSAVAVTGPHAVEYAGDSILFALESLQELLVDQDFKSCSKDVIDWVAAKMDSREVVSALSFQFCKVVAEFSGGFQNEEALVEELVASLALKDYVGVLRGISEEIFSPEAGVPLSIVTRLWLLKGESYIGLYKYEQAISYFSKVLEVESNNSRALLCLGHIAFSSQSYTEAITFYKRVADTESQGSAACLGLGMCYSGIGRERESYYWFRRCLGSDDQAGLAVSGIIQIALATSDQAWATQILEDLHEDEETEPQLILALGNLYMKSGRYAEGKELLSMVSKLL